MGTPDGPRPSHPLTCRSSFRCTSRLTMTPQRAGRLPRAVDACHQDSFLGVPPSAPSVLVLGKTASGLGLGCFKTGHLSLPRTGGLGSNNEDTCRACSPEPIRGSKHIPPFREQNDTQGAGGWDRKSVGLGQEKRGRQAGPQFTDIRRDPVAAGASPYPGQPALSEGVNKTHSTCCLTLGWTSQDTSRRV